ncbi:nitrate/nitrite transporter [Chitinimonas sp. BJYL2]|uniref:MFS transporter n=1 Tax=Chitinimonas sp. BJYL2 TaxID=2976696 RepID=UPI0022B40458|nr:MFS transporter [Chitinimonas sp. BJYL2]
MNRPHVIPLLAPFALGYFFSYGLRTINAAIAPRLIADLGISEAGLGLLTSVYFLTFAAAQLPIGLAIDRFGPRRVNATLLLIAVAGCLLFAVGQRESVLLLARALIGLGVSGALMTSIKHNAQWFSLRELPAMNGWVHVWGLVGAVVSTVPVAWLVGTTGIVGAFMAAASVGLAASLLLWFVAPEKPHEGEHESLRENLAGTVSIFRSRAFWSLATVAGLALGSHMAMQGLWVGQWLRQVGGLGEAAVGQALLWMMLAGAVGALGWGQLATRLSAHGVAPLTVYGTACGLHVLVLIALAANPAVPAPVMTAAYALTGMGGSLCYAVLTARFPVALAGRVNTSVNLLIFAVAFGLQAGAGYLLALLGSQFGLSTPQAYTALLLGLAAIIATTLAWALFDKPHPGPASAS